MADKKQMTLNAEQMKAIKSNFSGGGIPWKIKIAQYLKEHQGATDIEIFDATRGADAKNKEGQPFSKSQKVKNLASQYTYMRDMSYFTVKEDERVYLLTEPARDKNGKIIKDQFIVLEGQEDRVEQLL